jgi:hypothetical protein
MIKTRYAESYNNPIWLMYECEEGQRWTTVKDGVYEHPQGEPCNYSGCQPNHQVRVIGETDDREKAIAWAKKEKEDVH